MISAVITQPMMVPTMRSLRRCLVMLKLGLRMMTMVSTIQ